MIISRQSAGHSIRQGATDSAHNFDPVKITIFGPYITLGFLSWTSGHEMQETARGIAAEQGALRPLENFYPLEIVHGKTLSLRHGDVGIIDINGNGRFGLVVEVVLRHAPNVELQVLTGDVSTHVYAWCQHGDVGALVKAHPIHLLTGEGRDGDTDILRTLLTLLCGDDNLLQHAAALGVSDGYRMNSADDCDGEYGLAENTVDCHLLSPSANGRPQAQLRFSHQSD